MSVVDTAKAAAQAAILGVMNKLVPLALIAGFRAAFPIR